MYLLNSCCCGCSLKNGTKAIGILTIISTVSHDIMTYYGLNPVSKDMGIDITAWESIISSITYIIAAIFLLLADVKNKPGFLLPWLVLETIAILMLPYYLYLFTFHLNTALLLTIVLGFGIASLVLEIYIWLVVYSYYKELKSTIILANEIPTNPV